MSRRRWLPVGLALGGVVAACGSGGFGPGAADGDNKTEDDRPAVVAPAVVDGCDRSTIGEESGPVVVAYGVVDGVLGPTCFGRPEPMVETAWAELASVAPGELLDGITLVAGFEPNASGTIAFASPVDDDTEEFLIALDVVAGEDDPQELRVTLAHELAHVFTQRTDQLDVAIYADECDTFFNGFGCFAPDAYVTTWIDEFWSPADVASLPPSGEIDEAAGADRCAVDPGFPGSYAASHPEEDFAEAFAAYVFSIDLPDAVDSRLAFFDEYPPFVEMRRAVVDAGWAGGPNNFEACG